MSSFGGVRGEEVAGTRPAAPSSLQLEDLPVETLIEVLSHVDFEALDNLLLTSRQLRSVIRLHWSAILPSIIEREFSPARGFFDAFWDLDLPCGLDYFQLLSATSTLNGLAPLLGFCRIVKRWEAEFTRLRFANAPELTRSLRPNELCRLRQALYFWWRFARAFHGPDAPSLDSGVESRRIFVRQLSTTQLHELCDLWDTVRRAVERKVCPSVSAVMGLGGKLLTMEEATRIGWDDDSENRDIVDTMLKLRPEDILHLLVYRHRYATKGSVVQFVRLRHPRIEESVECFTGAIVDVMRERNMSVFWPFPWVGGFDGGILDHNDAGVERLRVVHGCDAGTGPHDHGGGLRRVLPPLARRGRLESSS